MHQKKNKKGKTPTNETNWENGRLSYSSIINIVVDAAI